MLKFIYFQPGRRTDMMATLILIFKTFSRFQSSKMLFCALLTNSTIFEKVSDAVHFIEPDTSDDII